MTEADFSGGQGAPLLLFPDPLEEETFGSWLERCAVSYRQDSVGQFVEGLLALEGHRLPLREWDWDTAPPKLLLEFLARRTRFGSDALKELLVAPRPHVLPPGQRDAYCPECFKEDLASAAVHRRRQWLNCWRLTCDRHGVVLGVYVKPSEPSDQLWVWSSTSWRDQMRLGVRELGMVVEFEPPRFVWKSNRISNQVIHRKWAWFDHEVRLDKRSAALAVLMGCEEGHELHYALYFQRLRKQLLWRDRKGRLVGWSMLQRPLGTIEARLQAQFSTSVIWPLLTDRSRQVGSNPKVWLNLLVRDVIAWRRAENWCFVDPGPLHQAEICQ